MENIVVANRKCVDTSKWNLEKIAFFGNIMDKYCDKPMYTFIFHANEQSLFDYKDGK